MDTITITIKTEGKNYEVVLNKPLFKEYRMASMALMAQPGYIDKLGAGSSLVQHCWVSGDVKLKKGDESKDSNIATAYATLCLDAYDSLYNAFESEVKKN